MALIQKLFRKISYVLAPFYLFFFLFYGCAGNSNDPQGAGAPSLVKLEITPLDPSIAKGTTRQFTATGFFSDNSTQDLTASVTVTWSSSNTTVATVSNAAGSQGLASGSATGTTTIIAATGSISGNTTLTVTPPSTPPSLDSISVTSSNGLSMAPLTFQQFTAMGRYSDNSTQDLTLGVTWDSSNPSVATVSNLVGSQGMVSALAAGTTIITAALDGISKSTTLTVTPAMLGSISVTPSNPSIAAGTTLPFKATGNYSDNTTQDLTLSVTWSSSDASIATVSNTAGSRGLASGLAAGPTTIMAVSGAISGSTTLTVTTATLIAITVTSSNLSIVAGRTGQFTATGYYSDGATTTTQDVTTIVTWSSLDTSIATISNAVGRQGLASGLAAGTTKITAALGNISGSADLAVTPATLVSLTVIPLKSVIALGTVQQFNAMGTYTDHSTQDLTPSVIWSSSNATVATISNSAGTVGLASALSVGRASITAASGSISGSGTLSVATVVVADLQVQSLSGSLSGSKLYVNDTEYNSGNQTAGAFTVTFYLSAAATLNTATDTPLGTRSPSGLSGGGTNSAASAYSIPSTLAMGSYHLCAMTDSENIVTESDETNNTRCTVGTYQVGPDLSVSSLSGSLSGTKLYVSDTELNSGNQPAGAFDVAFYLSANTLDPTTGTLLGSRNLTGLAAGMTNSATTAFAVPSSMVGGAYYLCAITDLGNAVTVTESNETNNTRCTTGTYKIGSDLLVNGISGSLSGTKLYVSDTELNSGNQPAGAFDVAFYLSANTLDPTTGTLLGSRNLTGLAGGSATNSTTTTFVVPASMPGGYYYLCAITDSGGVVAETNEANNTKCTTGTYKIGPDLLVYAISSSLSGSTVYVNDTEMNSGSQPASGFTVSFYLSADTAYDSGDYSLGSSRDVSGLAGGNATNSKTTSIPIPSGPPAGNYYIIAVTDSDNVIIETNETNNIKVSSGTVTVP